MLRFRVIVFEPLSPSAMSLHGPVGLRFWGLLDLETRKALCQRAILDHSQREQNDGVVHLVDHRA